MEEYKWLHLWESCIGGNNRIYITKKGREIYCRAASSVKDDNFHKDLVYLGHFECKFGKKIITGDMALARTIVGPNV